MSDGAAPAAGILVVDDEGNLCWILSRLLSECGYAVKTAPNCARAREAFGSFICHVALVDYRLPDGNGIALIAELARRRPHLRAILMTSYGNARLQKEAADAGLFAYFNKPFNNALMIETVSDAVREALSGIDSPPAGTGARTRFPAGLKTP